jgi:hypothetical protein
MQAATSTRNYTEERIKPLLETELERRTHFHPETVPAFSANRVFEYLRQEAYKDYAYRGNRNNPTNLANRAVDWEADIINTFRNHGDMDRMVGERDTPTGRSLFVARPMRANEICIDREWLRVEARRGSGGTRGFGSDGRTRSASRGVRPCAAGGGLTADGKGNGGPGRSAYDRLPRRYPTIVAKTGSRALMTIRSNVLEVRSQTTSLISLKFSMTNFCSSGLRPEIAGSEGL